MSSHRTSSGMAVEVRGLTKNFGFVHALRGLDLTVPTGQVTGFLGPNGSGKTATIRVLLWPLRADGGTASLCGGDLWSDPVALHRRIAYVPGDVMLLACIAVALFGWFPSAAIPVTWGAMAAMWIATMLGEVFGFPTWLLNVLPSSAVPHMPLESMSWRPVIVMTAVACAPVWAGIA